MHNPDLAGADLAGLDRPWVVSAFSGWNDAADAASALVEHLIESLDATVVAELDSDEFYDFQVNRPLLRSVDGLRRHLVWPQTTVHVARRPQSPVDLILVSGPEPNMRWQAYCTQLLDLAESAGAQGVVTLGALLADVPHSRPVPVSVSSPDPSVVDRLGLRPSTYTGPVGITAVLNDAAHLRGLTPVSLWAAVPHYLQDPPCPKASFALLGHLEDTLDVALPQGELEELSAAWQRGADEAVADDEDVREYVGELEQAIDEGELPEATGDAIAREFERYLRRRGPES